MRLVFDRRDRFAQREIRCGHREHGLAGNPDESSLFRRAVGPPDPGLEGLGIELVDALRESFESQQHLTWVNHDERAGLRDIAAVPPEIGAERPLSLRSCSASTRHRAARWR